MRFVKMDDLKTGMRIARPIYNKKGVLLYDRGSKLTEQAISSIKNFGLIGIFALDPAEPVPPMSEEDIEFERFQTINIYAIEDELKGMIANKKAHKCEFIVNDIIKTYGHLHHKVNFIQNLRSNEDFIYKHSLNVAILAAMISHKMNVPVEAQTDCITACLVHDIGKLMVPSALLDGEDDEERDRILENSQVTGFDFIETVFSSNANIKRICAQTQRVLADKKLGREQDKMKILVGTRVMLVAEVYDSMTAMNSQGEPKSEVVALRYLLSAPDVFNKKAVEALVDSINILGPGTSVELTNGSKALVISNNTGDILRPMVLDFSSNQIIDLSNRKLYDDLEIADIMKTMDNRYVMDDASLKKYGIK